MKEILKYIPITTIIILFLFTCGGLYLIGYWSTFNIDITNFVELMEIPKSFIFPFAVTWGIYFFIVILQAIGTAFIAKKIPIIAAPEKSFLNKGFFKLINRIDFWIILLPLILLALFCLFDNSSIFWITSSLITGHIFFTRSILSKSISSIFPKNQWTFMILIFGIFTPLMSFAFGKAKSLNIYHNKEIKYIKNVNVNNAKTINAAMDSASFKLLGFLGDKFIISSLDNKQIFILNQSAFDVLELNETK